MEKSSENILYFITAITFVILLFVVAVISLLLTGRNRRLKYKYEKLKMTSDFQEEMNSTKNEVMEQVFSDVAMELHDNVSQKMTVALMNLNRMKEDDSGNVIETRGIINQLLREVREVSHMLSRDYWNQFNLKESINILEMQLLRIKNIKTNFQITDDINDLREEGNVINENIGYLEKDTEILIFRVIQELINNSLKHSKADTISLKVDYQLKQLQILYSDNGVGINEQSGNKSKGLGMSSIKTRMELCKAAWNIESSGGKGFIFKATIPINI